MGIKFGDEIAKEIKERGFTEVGEGYVTGESYEEWLYEDSEGVEDMKNCNISDRECRKGFECRTCGIWAAKVLGYETLENPIKDGKYLCALQFYTEKDDIIETEAEFYGEEWKITDTWNMLGWKKLKDTGNFYGGE